MVCFGSFHDKYQKVTFHTVFRYKHTVTLLSNHIYYLKRYFKLKLFLNLFTIVNVGLKSRIRARQFHRYKSYVHVCKLLNTLKLKKNRMRYSVIFSISTHVPYLFTGRQSGFRIPCSFHRVYNFKKTLPINLYAKMFSRQ